MGISKKLQKKVQTLPQKPGVYQFLGAQKKLLYIGKANNLRSRVQSYFRASSDLSPAKQQMVQEIVDVTVTMVDSEAEALLLETILIKKYRPRFNIIMKDDKNYQYIHITDEPYPQLETTRTLYSRQRGRIVRKPGTFYGPYTSGRKVRAMIRLLKTIFQYCDTPPRMVRGAVQFPERPCLKYQMQRCVGPCADAISQEEYQKLFKQIKNFLDGDYKTVQVHLEQQMQDASQQEQFERASEYRDQLAAIEKLLQEQKVVSTKRDNADYISMTRNTYIAAVNMFTIRKGVMIQQQVFFLAHVEDNTDEEVVEAFKDQYYASSLDVPSKIYCSTEDRRGRHRRLLEMGVQNAEFALESRRASYEQQSTRTQQGLLDLATAIGAKSADALHRIEIYDISNIQGTHMVGAMAVFIDGLPAPAEYRKFKIKTVDGANDVAAMKEVLMRRLKRMDSTDAEQWPQPDLIIVDGGQAQLNTACDAIELYKKDIPVIALAKREEEVYIPGRTTTKKFSKKSPGLFLLQRMRDEAHRFAIGFYRKRHLKSITE